MAATAEKGGIFWRNILLACTAAFLMLAIVGESRPRAATAAFPWLLSMLVIALGGLFAALGIREFAGVIFRLENKPWYTQRGGIIFLLAMLIAVNFLVLTALAWSQLAQWLPGSISLPGHVYACMSAELFWVVVLDWPRATRRVVQPRTSSWTQAIDEGDDTTPPHSAPVWQSPLITPTPIVPPDRVSRGRADGLLKMRDEHQE